MKTITITVHQGIIEIESQDKGTTLVVKDFDVQEETEWQEDGRYYERSTYEEL
jgi:hypothetical protein